MTNTMGATSRERLKVLVVGATGGSGRAAVNRLLSAGHAVTAFARRAGQFEIASQRLQVFIGDVMNPSDVERAVQGQDAVIVTLGISENPLRVRILGPSRTPIEVRSAGTRNVVSAMRKQGVRKLVVQSSYGVGETRHRLGLVNRMFFAGERSSGEWSRFGDCPTSPSDG
jgi:nucleoside-diphosphate-sugar epimerase